MLHMPETYETYEHILTKSGYVKSAHVHNTSPTESVQLQARFL